MRRCMRTRNVCLAQKIRLLSPADGEAHTTWKIQGDSNSATLLRDALERAEADPAVEGVYSLASLQEADDRVRHRGSQDLVDYLEQVSGNNHVDYGRHRLAAREQ